LENGGTNVKIEVLDLFAGVGGIAEGLKRSSEVFDIAHASEIDLSAIKTYGLNCTAKIWGNIQDLVYSDLGNVFYEETKNVEMITAGFPCQPFSVAGNRLGLNDSRGNLFFTIMDYIKGIKERYNRIPRFLLFENVLGLLTQKSTVELMIEAMNLHGYKVKTMKLNSSQYGALQSRARVYILGFRDATDYINFKYEITEQKPQTFSSFLEGSVADKYYYTKEKFPNLFTDDGINLEKSITEEDGFYQLRRTYVRHNKKNQCPTLTANMGTGGHNVPLIKDKRGIRKLTPRETFLLQGFDNIKLPKIADCHLYKQSGNSVYVPVIVDFGKAFAKIIKNQGEKNDKNTE